MTQSESYLVSWLVEPGDVVAEGADLAEVDTNKATTTIQAPVAGTVGDHLVDVDDEIAYGAPITWIEDGS